MYRDDLAALTARHAALEAEVAHKRRELETTAQLLDDARGARKLPVLADIRVASPCKASWADMTGDERVRHCGECKKNVYNLSEMTRDEAEALIFAHEGRLCVRYFQRTDGTILFGDCWVGAQRRRRFKVAAVATAAALAGGAIATQIGYELKRVFSAEAGLQVIEGEAYLQVQGGMSELPISEPHEVMMGDYATVYGPLDGTPLTREAAVEEAYAVLRGERTPEPTDFSVPGSPPSLAREHER